MKRSRAELIEALRKTNAARPDSSYYELIVDAAFALGQTIEEHERYLDRCVALAESVPDHKRLIAFRKNVVRGLIEELEGSLSAKAS